MKILSQMYLWTRKKWLNFGTYLLLDHKDMKTEKLEHYNSSDSMTTPPLFTMDRKQATADNKEVNHNLWLMMMIYWVWQPEAGLQRIYIHAIKENYAYR